MKTSKKKTTQVNLPQSCICGSKRGSIEVDTDDGSSLYVLKCKCGAELDHSMHKELLGRRI